MSTGAGKKPCRGCDDKEVRVTKREFKAMAVAAHERDDLKGRLKDSERDLALSRREARIAQRESERLSELAVAVLGEKVGLHRSYGEPWEVCPPGCEDFEREHRAFYQGPA